MLEWEVDARSGSLDPYGKLGGDCDGMSLSPNGRHVYVTDNDQLRGYAVASNLAVFDATAGALRTSTLAATRIAVANQRALFLRPEDQGGGDGNDDGDTEDHAVELLDTSGAFDVLTSLHVAGRRIALSDQLMAFTVPEGSEDDRDRNHDFDTTDSILAVAEIGPSPVVRDLGVAADIVAVSGTSVVFSRPEWMEPANAPGCEATIPPGGCDLNGNGTATDRVLHVYRHKPGGIGKIENTRIQISRGNTGFEGQYDPRYPDRPDFYLVGNVVALLTDEDATGIDLTQNGYPHDRAIQLVDISGTTSEIINPALMAIPCSFPSCEPGVPYRMDPVRGTVSFVVWELSQGADLDGNGSSSDFVLEVYNLLNGKRQLISLFAPDVLIPQASTIKVARLPETFIDGQLVYSQIRESDYNIDLNGDGVINGAVAVALTADSDDDGVFDGAVGSNDTCVDDANGDDVDADGDGLGDFTCDPSPIRCPAAPRNGCAQIAIPGKGSIDIKDSQDDTKDQIKWSWNKGAETLVSQFGNPVDGATHYALCVYDANGTRPQPVSGSLVRPRRVCDPIKNKRCWATAGTSGFKMTDKLGADDGITQITLKAGVAGKAKIQVKGQGTGLDMPALGLALPVRVQLVALNGAQAKCWEATYSTALTNDGAKFKAKSD